VLSIPALAELQTHNNRCGFSPTEPTPPDLHPECHSRRSALRQAAGCEVAQPICLADSWRPATMSVMNAEPFCNDHFRMYCYKASASSCVAEECSNQHGMRRLHSAGRCLIPAGCLLISNSASRLSCGAFYLLPSGGDLSG